METYLYPVLILGGGPIAASTAYFLAERGVHDVGLITLEPADTAYATYLNAGGTVRWFWSDPERVLITKETGDFVTHLSHSGVDLSYHRDQYLFLHRGKSVPALSINTEQLVQWFIHSAKSRGLVVHAGERVTSVTSEGTVAIVHTERAEYRARKVLLALGVQNSSFMPGLSLEREKRQLFVLDLPVGEDEKSFPHVVIPLGKGTAYLFIKRMPEGLRFVVGQEEVLTVNTDPEPENYFPRLLKAGLGDLFPFLKNAHVEKILWGFDAHVKSLVVTEEGPLVAANCGSAVRSCVWAGQTLAERLSWTRAAGDNKVY